MTIEKGATVGDVFSQVLTEKGYTFVGLSKNYIRSITTPGGLYMAEFTNGNLSGWMYTVNGHHPEVGLNSYILTGGDRIIWHYTDDYTKEEGSEKWNTQNDKVKEVTTTGASSSATTITPTTVQKSGDTAKATISADNQKEVLKQAKENKSKEIVLQIAPSDTAGADKIQTELAKSMVSDIVKDTNAELTIQTEAAVLTIDQATLKQLAVEAKGSTITIEVSRMKATAAEKKLLGDSAQTFELTVISGGAEIKDFNGKILVKLPIPTVLKEKKATAVHIDSADKFTQMAGERRTIDGKEYYQFYASHFSNFALVDADEAGIEVEDEAANIAQAKALTAKLTPIARSAKTAKKNVKVTVSLDKQDKAIIKELKDAGYTVKYRFYRSTKKAAGYKAAVTKKTASYTNTSGKKGTKYFYKVQVRVYDENGKLTAKTALKQCKYASRIWAKAATGHWQKQTDFCGELAAKKSSQDINDFRNRN